MTEVWSTEYQEKILDGLKGARERVDAFCAEMEARGYGVERTETGEIIITLPNEKTP